MTTFAENPTSQSSMPPAPPRVLDTLPSCERGTVPLVGQFVALFRDGQVHTGWLMDAPTETTPNPAGVPHLEAKVLTADGQIIHARRTRAEWMDAQRENRKPSAAILFNVHRKGVEELERVARLAHEYADENDLCGVFDDFLEENGLPSRRDRHQSVKVDVSMSVYIDCSGVTEEDAYEDGVDTEEVVAAVRRLLDTSPESVDYDPGY